MFSDDTYQRPARPFYLSEEADGPGDAVRAILAHPLEHAPGALPVYSCMGYILLGRILEQIGGQSIDRLAQEYVFEPLGLTHTTYRPAGVVAPTERDPATGELLRGAVHDENARFLGVFRARVYSAIFAT
ncbi:MAG: serine hydrolase domain-containing protein [Ruthenibacterium lactatiformans]